MDIGMPEPPSHHLAGLESSSAVAFTKSLKDAVKGWRAIGSDQKKGVITALMAVARTQGINETEQNRRAGLVLS